MSKNVAVIGCGFAGLSAACHLAKAGAQVTVFEKNTSAGGRARFFTAAGFTFDMGPSWYWMPDVFERFFACFGKTPEDFYQLVRLNPSYQVFWEDGETLIPADIKSLKQLFESIEPGSGKRLEQYLKDAELKYKTAMKNLVYNTGISIWEYINYDALKTLFHTSLLTSVYKHARRYFTNPKLLRLIEFPILFLGALPKNTPALYSIMNYADAVLGTWYPMGGMASVVNALYELAHELGVHFKFNDEINTIVTNGKRAITLKSNSGFHPCDAVIASGDYNYMEQLLPSKYRNYNGHYWQTRKMAPSSLLYYIGLSKKINGLQHHNLFFDEDFNAHAHALYENPSWPSHPLMYVCCPSKTDVSVAPEGAENLFILIPVASGLIDNEAIKEKYFSMAIDRIEQKTKTSIMSHIVYKRSYAGSNFMEDYHAFKGNAYGLANTLKQTALFKPSLFNKKIHNLFYSGQLTVPGPGVPPSIISGGIAAREASKLLHLKPITL